MIQRGKDVFAVCSCGRESLVLAFVDGGAFCPACAPTPDTTPHDYRPVKPLQKGGVVKLTDEQARSIFSYARNGVCCLDPGDCGGPCGLV